MTSQVSNVSSALRRLRPFASPGQGLRWGWIALETLVANVLGLAFLFWVAPADPFGLDSPFPWVWLVPTVLAMRYGTAVGIASVLLLVAAWYWHESLAGGAEVLDAFPKEFFLGGLLLNLLAGQFSDIWNIRTRRLRAVNAYLDERLTTLTRNHFLLRLSHQRLEQDLIAKPLTLRDTLMRLREVSQAQRHEAALPGAQDFMHLLGQSCQLEIAAIYRTEDGQPLVTPEGMIGEAQPLDLADPLLAHCLEQNALVHVQAGSVPLDARDASRYVVCAPVLSSDCELVAIVAVERMPFFALNEDVLKLLTVLAGYYADGLKLDRVAGAVLEKLPTCPREMALDLVRLHRIRAQAGIESALVALVFDNDSMGQDLFEQVKRFRRGVDLAWELKSDQHLALITLLPLAGNAAIEGYLLRVEHALAAQFGASFLDNHVVTHTARLGHQSPADTLSGLVARCGF